MVQGGGSELERATAASRLDPASRLSPIAALAGRPVGLLLIVTDSVALVASC